MQDNNEKDPKQTRPSAPRIIGRWFIGFAAGKALTKLAKEVLDQWPW